MPLTSENPKITLQNLVKTSVIRCLNVGSTYYIDHTETSHSHLGLFSFATIILLRRILTGIEEEQEFHANVVRNIELEFGELVLQVVKMVRERRDTE